MADSFTVNYGWTKPDIGASDDTWGDKWNANLDGIDAQIRAEADKTGIPEAPDNQTYGRAAGAWNLVVPASGGAFTGSVALGAGGAVTGGGLLFVGSAALSLPGGPSQFTMGGGSAGWALTTDGAGTLSWAPVVTGGPYVPISGATMTGPLTMQGSNMIALNSPLASGQSAILGQKAGLNRWQMMIGDYTAEGVNNVGSNFSLVAFSTTGAMLGTWLTIARADGSTVFNGAGVTIQGALAVNGVLALASPNNLAIYGGTPGQFLQTNGSGVLTWATPAGGGGGGIPDAPSDGQLYGRHNANWSVVPASLPDAPSNNQTYGRNNAAWTQVVSFPEAPPDGQYYARRQLAWQAIPPGGATISDTAPASPSVGQMWWDSVGGQLYVWYQDPNTSQWVASSSSGPAASITLPLPLGVAAVGTSAAYARGDHVHPTVQDAYSHDNRIINGDMRIDQRNNGAQGTATGVYTIDRWFHGATQASKGTWGRGATGPSLQAIGFSNYLNYTSSSAYTALAADVFRFSQPIEADMVSDFAWGTPNAQPVTLSFWAASAVLTGTFSGSITNATRSYPFIFSIPTAGVWAKNVVTIPGDTVGPWVLSGAGAGLTVGFDLGCGANFRAPAGAWASGNFIGATGAVSVVATNGAGLNITGVKLEIGSVATPYNRQSLAKSMVDCQRYYQVGEVQNQGISAGAGGYATRLPLPVSMRAAPTLTPSFTTQNGGTGSLVAGVNGPGFLAFICTVTSVAGTAFSVFGTWTASAEL